jgi:hypothetical protein
VKPPQIVTEGPLFDRLMQISAGKWMTVRLPVARPLAYDRLSGPADPIRSLAEYEEWEPVHMADGRIGWRKK